MEVDPDYGSKIWFLIGLVSFLVGHIFFLKGLNKRIENSRLRYTKQFSDMNSAVTGFKKTEELLTNFQEAWRASLKR